MNTVSRTVLLVFASFAANVGVSLGQNPSALDSSDGSPANVVSVDAEGDVTIVGRDNNGTESALEIVSGSQKLLLDGNEIDSAAGLYLNNNSVASVSLVTGGGNVGVGTDSPKSKLVVTNNGFVGSLNWALAVDSQTSDSSSGILNLRDSGGTSVFFARGDGRIGVGTTNPGSELSVVGVIESTTGGVKFPDGSVQTSAATGAPSGPAGGDLSGIYPSPEIAANTVVRSLNGLRDAVSIESGSPNVEIEPGPSNSLEISVSPSLPAMAADQSFLTQIEGFEILVDTGFGQRIRRLELMMAYAPGAFSQATWVDPDADGAGVLMMTYTDDSGGVERLVLSDSAKVARYQTGASDGQDWDIETFANGTFRLSKSTTFGSPSFPTFFEFAWVAEP